MDLNSLGLVGVLVRNAPDVDAALNGLSRLLHLHTQDSEVTLTVDGSQAILSFSVVRPSVVKSQ